MTDPDAEILRRRLYAPDATESDVQRYEEARSIDRPAVRPDAGAGGGTPQHRRRPVVLAVAGAGLVVLTIAVGLSVQPPSADPVPSIRPPALAELVPIVVYAPDGITDAVFAEPLGDRSERAERTLVAAVDRTVAPGRDAATSGGGRSGGSAGLVSAIRRRPAARGDVLVLEMITRSPTIASWRMLGRRRDEPAIGHPVLVATSDPPTAEGTRILAMRVSLPERMTFSGFQIVTEPDTPFVYRYALYQR